MTHSARVVLGCLFLSASVAQAGVSTTGYVYPSDPTNWAFNDEIRTDVGDGNSDATLTIDGGSSIESWRTYVGNDNSTVATVTITGDGSQWECFHAIIGGYGNGVLNINAGGTILASSTLMGVEKYSTGIVTVSGNNSKWINSAGIGIGIEGAGTANILNGATASCDYCAIGAFESYSSGIINVSGIGSKLTIETDLLVGSWNLVNGYGIINITEGGLISVDEHIRIDGNEEHNSYINMSTGGTLAVKIPNQFDGFDTVRWWNDSINAWAPLSTATEGEDYTYEYQNTGDWTGYTLLTVGTVPVPEPGAIALIFSALVAMGMSPHEKNAALRNKANRHPKRGIFEGVCKSLGA